MILVDTALEEREREGRPIRVRYIWSHITGNSAHWEQAFSLDESRTWETNWTSELRRVSAA